MAKIFKIEILYVDADDEYEDVDHFSSNLEGILERVDGRTEVSNKQESKEFEWDDSLVINRTDATLEDYEKYFE